MHDKLAPRLNIATLRILYARRTGFAAPSSTPARTLEHNRIFRPRAALYCRVARLEEAATVRAMTET